MTGATERAPARTAGNVVFTLVVVGFLAVTNEWLGFRTAIVDLGANDAVSYLWIADAAPHWPDVLVPSAHAQRWPLHWAIGTGAWASGASVETAYWIALGACVAALAFVGGRCWRAVGADDVAWRICTAALFLNPYSLRWYLLVPTYMADLWCAVGIGLAMLGLLRRRWPLLLAGVVATGLVRQTVLVVAPVLALWVLVDPRWRTMASRARAAIAVATIALAGTVYLVVTQVADTFEKPFEPSIPADTIVATFGDLPGSASEIVDHTLRTAAPLLLVGGLLVGATIALVQRAGWRAVPRDAWLSLLVAASVAGQPWAFSPDYVVRNEPRLAAIAVLPVCVALAAVLGAQRAATGRPASMPVPWVIATVLGVASLHHLYSVLGPPGPGALFAIQVAGGITGGLVVWWMLRPAQSATDALSGAPAPNAPPASP